MRSWQPTDDTPEIIRLDLEQEVNDACRVNRSALLRNGGERALADEQVVEGPAVRREDRGKEGDRRHALLAREVLRQQNFGQQGPTVETQVAWLPNPCVSAPRVSWTTRSSRQLRHAIKLAGPPLGIRASARARKIKMPP